VRYQKIGEDQGESFDFNSSLAAENLGSFAAGGAVQLNEGIWDAVSKQNRSRRLNGQRGAGFSVTKFGIGNPANQ
jgi:hypothetical protein